MPIEIICGDLLPTLRELRIALDAMTHCRVTYTNQTGSWQADIFSLADEANWTTVVVTDQPSADMDSPVKFYFEKGSSSLMIDLLTRLAPRVGALMLHPHTGDRVVLCVDAEARTFKELDAQ